MITRSGLVALLLTAALGGCGGGGAETSGSTDSGKNTGTESTGTESTGTGGTGTGGTGTGGTGTGTVDAGGSALPDEEVPLVQAQFGRSFTIPTYDMSLPAIWPAGVQLIRTQAELDATWATARPAGSAPPGYTPLPPVPPQADFAAEALAWVSGGEGSCTGFQVRRITRIGFDYTVEWGENDGPPDAGCAGIMTMDLDILRIPRPVGTVTFVRKDICSPYRTEHREYCI